MRKLEKERMTRGEGSSEFATAHHTENDAGTGTRLDIEQPRETSQVLPTDSLAVKGAEKGSYNDLESAREGSDRQLSHRE